MRPSPVHSGEGDLAHELGRHPVDARGNRGAASNGLSRRRRLRSRGTSARRSASGEARADLARIPERRAVPHSHQEGPEPHARALRLGVTADHHLLPLETLGLEPGHRRGRTCTGRRAASTPHPEAEPTGATEEGAATARHVRGVAHRPFARVRLREQCLQRGLATLQG